jgi:sigma-B regulation protein RsbU (phosphoserine phosphatase)
LEAEGLPLGSALAGEYEAAECLLPPGATLVLYSDGVVEAQTHGGALYGYPRFERVLSQMRGLPAAQVWTYIAKDVGAFLRQKPPDDDITVVVIRSV